MDEQQQQKPKTLTKAALIDAATGGRWWNYNRRLSLAAVQALPDGGTYPVVAVVPHYYRQGVPCEEHRRVGVQLDGEFATFDVPTWYYDALPEAG